MPNKIPKMTKIKSKNNARSNQHEFARIIGISIYFTLLSMREDP